MSDTRSEDIDGFNDDTHSEDLDGFDDCKIHLEWHCDTYAAELAEFNNFEPSYEEGKIAHALAHRKLYMKEGTMRAAIDYEISQDREVSQSEYENAWSRRCINPIHNRELRSSAASKNVSASHVPIPNKKRQLFVDPEDQKVAFQKIERQFIIPPGQIKRRMSIEITRYFRALRDAVMNIAVRANIEKKAVDVFFEKGMQALVVLMKREIFTDESEWLIHQGIREVTREIFLRAKNPCKTTSKRMHRIYGVVVNAAKDLGSEAQRQNEFGMPEG